MNSQHFNNAVEAMSANVVNTKFENFDEATVNLAKNRIIDLSLAAATPKARQGED